MSENDETVFTPEGYERLRKAISVGEHDGLIQAERLDELHAILDRAKIVKPVEQRKVVQIGTAVVVKDGKGRPSKFIVDGCLVAIPVDNGRHVSIDSPLGQAILGARKGETRTLALPGGTRKIRIVNIFPPSQAEAAVETRAGKKKTKK